MDTATATLWKHIGTIDDIPRLGSRTVTNKGDIHVSGDMASATVFNDDPVAQAKVFETQGFEWLHIVATPACLERADSVR